VFRVLNYLLSSVLKILRRLFTLLLRVDYFMFEINHLNPELNPICYLLALLEFHHILDFSGVRVKVVLRISYDFKNSIQ